MKYKFDGIGRAAATWQFALLATTPLAPLTNGFFGKVVFYFLVRLNMALASYGLIMLNVGISNLQIDAQEKEYSKVIDNALEKVRNKNGKLTKEEADEIDAQVIAAFERFAVFGKLRG